MGHIEEIVRIWGPYTVIILTIDYGLDMSNSKQTLG